MPGPVSAVACNAASPSRPSVVLHPDPESLALAAASSIVQQARRSVKDRGRCSIALAGGATPRRTYELLARPPFVELMPWDDVHIFWGDERCVEPTDPRSNERMAREALLDHVPIPPDQVHPMRCGGEDPDSPRPADPRAEIAARRRAEEYEGLLRAYFAPIGDAVGAGLHDRAGQAEPALDLVLLGLGEDGHTASLFPGSEVLRDEKRWVAATFVDTGPGAGPPGAGPLAAGGDVWRVTLTASFINGAAAVVFLVSGRAKAATVRDVLEGPIDSIRLPAQLIRPKNGTLFWHLDDDSAALLSLRPERS